MEIELRGAADAPLLLWRAGPGWRMLSSGALGGGLGRRTWVINAQVPVSYARTDPAAHLRELADPCGLEGPGVGMLTAAAVRHYTRADEQGVRAMATVGLSVPTWAVNHHQRLPAAAPRPGTVNIVAALPVPLDDAALVNAVMTATEAKSQALLEAGFAGTGTASDAVCLAAPHATGRTAREPFCGPRSVWGARLARAVHRTVLQGALSWRARHPDGRTEASAQAAARAGRDLPPGRDQADDGEEGQHEQRP
ncbi:adenosylcobinamide amidohydrolase [Streptomyces sp. NPDC057638]|uniref:adenosylcobinamide amidohydrolase n=1 Tax=Streptomyces sp. NPDC057638 TaxID=3346190 RepID=UPI0036C7F666